MINVYNLLIHLLTVVLGFSIPQKLSAWYLPTSKTGSNGLSRAGTPLVFPRDICLMPGHGAGHSTGMLPSDLYSPWPCEAGTSSILKVGNHRLGMSRCLSKVPVVDGNAVILRQIDPPFELLASSLHCLSFPCLLSTWNVWTNSPEFQWSSRLGGWWDVFKRPFVCLPACFTHFCKQVVFLA